MANAQVGDRIRVCYKGIANNGIVFDIVEEEDPFEFTLGEAHIFPGFKKVVTGLGEGETRTLVISPENGYGYYKKDLVIVVQRSQFVNDVEIKTGIQMEVQSPEGTPIEVTVKEVTDQTVKLDANHPLAGESFTFQVKLVEIV